MRSMSESEDRNTDSGHYVVHLPGFLVDEETGLGDAIKRATNAVGIRPCKGCARRAARLNRQVRFRPRTKRTP